ncbi:hypothetical protein EV121DRAFT_215816, partial [Schizophyllum commune]
DAEDVKDALIQLNPGQFYRIPSRAQGSTHRILYYQSYFQGWTCKIDVLLPYSHHLPALPSPYITWLEEIRAIPFALLLLHEL